MAAKVEIIWSTHNEYIIRDVHWKTHEKIRNFMLEKYFKPHRLFNHLKYQDDPETNNQYLKYLQHILQDESSIVVLHAERDSIHGVALLKCMTEEFRSWTCLQYCVDGGPLLDLVDLQFRTIFEYAGNDFKRIYNNLHLFEYYIDDELRSDSEFLKKFFNAIYETARHMKMSRVTSLALSSAEQRDCWEHGFERIHRMIYSLIVFDNRRRPFAPLRLIDESEAGLFAMDVEPLKRYTDSRLRRSMRKKSKSRLRKSVSRVSFSNVVDKFE